jgi:hypothetical protein
MSDPLYGNLSVLLTVLCSIKVSSASGVNEGLLGGLIREARLPLEGHYLITCMSRSSPGYLHPLWLCKPRFGPRILYRRCQSLFDISLQVVEPKPIRFAAF